MKTTLTRRFDRLDATEKDLCNSAIRRLAASSELNNFGCIYIIERSDDSTYRKAGVTDLANLADRSTKIALGDPAPHRVASLCLFYDREKAGYVERVLKDEYKRQNLQSQGGTEWYRAPRTKIIDDISRIAHQSMFQQIASNSSENVISLSSAPQGFYGLCIFHIIQGELVLQDMSPVFQGPNLDDEDTVEKRGIWNRMMSVLQSLR